MTTPPAQTPDLIQPIMGWRSWGWDATQHLTSIVIGGGWGSFGHYIWPARKLIAECMAGPYSAWRPDREHTPPGEWCACGLYAYHAQPHEWSEAAPGTIRGLVKAWGNVEVHAGGFRSEYMEIVAINFPSLHSAARQRFAWQIAEKYGVPLISSLEEMQLIANAYDSFVPAHLRGANALPAQN